MKSRLSPAHRRKLEALRQTYAQELPQKVRAVADAVASLPAGGWDTEAFEAAYVLVHRLTGSSATFGFEPIRQAAATLEALLLEAKERPELRRVTEPRLTALLAALRDALSAPSPPGRAGPSPRPAPPKARSRRHTRPARR
jgi:chemotaxis protein histidine kinase CheA